MRSTPIALLLAACLGHSPGSIDASATVERAIRFHPPSTYASYWYEMEQCSGRRGDFRAVEWYRVPTSNDHHTFPHPDGGFRWLYGIYISREHAIYLSSPLTHDPDLIRHEILHALGVIGHPSVFDRCDAR